VAYACAAKYCKNYVVTAALDQVFFKQQVNVGELVTFYAHVNHVGRSSMEIGVKVVAEHLRTNEKRHTTSCYFTMVAMDENGKSVEVPRLLLETDAEKNFMQRLKCEKKCVRKVWRKIALSMLNYQRKSFKWDYKRILNDCL